MTRGVGVGGVFGAGLVNRVAKALMIMLMTMKMLST